MKNEQTYTKGDIVWVEEPVEGSVPKKRPARIISGMYTIAYPNREPYIAIRYLDKQGTDAYQCIPQSWIKGCTDEEQPNYFQPIHY